MKFVHLRGLRGGARRPSSQELEDSALPPSLLNCQCAGRDGLVTGVLPSPPVTRQHPALLVSVLIPGSPVPGPLWRQDPAAFPEPSPLSWACGFRHVVLLEFVSLYPAPVSCPALSANK